MAPNHLDRRYLRSVTFLDASPDDGKELPVHVAHEVLLDNEPTAARVNLALGYSIAGGSGDGTVVSFCVHPDDVETPELGEAGEVVRWPSVAGRSVLIPHGNHWETVHAQDTVIGQGDWVRVSIFVREVKVLAAPRPVEEPVL